MWTNETSIKDWEQVFCRSCGGRNAPCSVAQVILDSPLRLVLDVHILMNKLWLKFCFKSYVHPQYLTFTILKNWSFPCFVLKKYCIILIIRYIKYNAFYNNWFHKIWTGFNTSHSSIFSDMIFSANILMHFVLN